MYKLNIQWRSKKCFLKSSQYLIVNKIENIIKPLEKFYNVPIFLGFLVQLLVFFVQ